MKNFLILLLISFIFISPLSYSQSLSFEITYGLSNTTIQGVKLIENSNGAFLLGCIGSLISTGDNFLCLINSDSTGHVNWNKFYSDTAGQLYLTGLEPAENNSYLLSGGTSIHYNADIFLTKVDNVGNIIWSQSYGKNSTSGYNAANGVKVLSDGNYLVYGYTNEYGNSYDSYIIKTDTSGNTLWAKTFGSINHNGSSDVVNTPDGNFCVLGNDSFFTSITKFDLYGNKLWNKTYVIQSALSQSSWSIKLCNDSGLIVAGVWDPDTNNGFYPFFLKTDNAGNVLWCKIYVGPTNAAEFFHVIETVDHGFLATWEPENVCTYCRSGLVKTDSLGNLQWANLYDLTEYNFPWNTIQTSDGGFAQIGFSIIPYKALLIKTDSSGYSGCHDTSVIVTPMITSVNVYDSCSVDSGFTVNLYPLIVTNPALTSSIPCLEILPVATFTSTDNSICPGSCLDFINLSVNSNSYQWFFPGATPGSSISIDPQNICYSLSGNYNVTLVSTNSFTSDTITLTNYITVYPYPSPQSITQIGDTLFAIAGSASYQWYFNGNIINGATEYFYVAQASGDYNVVATDANGCEVEAAIFNVIGEKMEIEIQSVAKNNSSYELDVHALPAGLYYIKITSSDKTFRSKFVKQ